MGQKGQIRRRRHRYQRPTNQTRIIPNMYDVVPQVFDGVHPGPESWLAKAGGMSIADNLQKKTT